VYFCIIVVTLVSGNVSPQLGQNALDLSLFRTISWLSLQLGHQAVFGREEEEEEEEEDGSIILKRSDLRVIFLDTR